MILLHPSIDPIIFSFGAIHIRWYSIAYIAAFLLGSYLIKHLNNSKISKIDNKLLDDFFIWAVLGVIFGGRIGYVIFYQFNYFLHNPTYIFYIWEGGMSFHGGLAGMIFSIFIFSKIKKTNFFALSDLISLVAPIGLFFGRIANFINIELIGKTTTFPIAIIYPTIDNLPRHPSQLYEALLEGLILFIILISVYLIKRTKISHGHISSIFLIFYGIVRFLIEFLREPDEHLGLFFNFFSMGQLLCIPLILFGIMILKKSR